MNYNTDIVAFSNIIAKLPQDFCDKHPVVVLGSGIFVITLPAICKGIKFLTKEFGVNYRYWVDAKYGRSSAIIIDTGNPMLLSQSSVT